jgi:hypothetical protein
MCFFFKKHFEDRGIFLGCSFPFLRPWIWRPVVDLPDYTVHTSRRPSGWAMIPIEKVCHAKRSSHPPINRTVTPRNGVYIGGIWAPGGGGGCEKRGRRRRQTLGGERNEAEAKSVGLKLQLLLTADSWPLWLTTGTSSVIKLCRPVEVHGRFGESYCLHLQGGRVCHKAVSSSRCTWTFQGK